MGFMCNTKINARKKSRLIPPPQIMMILIYIEKEKFLGVPIKISAA